MKQKKYSTGLNNQLQIIGGRWRGRKIAFPCAEDLRPTPARVRETLFNWLAPSIRRARCLDAFAGSGALGLEALSRGASWISFFDSNPKAINQINQHLAALEITQACCQIKAIPSAFEDPKDDPFDIIFLDPPFQTTELAEICRWADRYCKENTLIYLEIPKQLKDLPIPTRWRTLKEKQAGLVKYLLLICEN